MLLPVLFGLVFVSCLGRSDRIFVGYMRVSCSLLREGSLNALFTDVVSVVTPIRHYPMKYRGVSFLSSPFCLCVIITRFLRT